MKNKIRTIGIAAVLALFGAASTFAQTPPEVLNMSADLVRLSIAASNMTPNQPALDAGPLLEKALLYAHTNNIRRVIADKGAYYFLSLNAQSQDRHVVIPGLGPMTVDLQGSDLYFRHAQRLGITVYSARNFILENFTMDYMDLPFTQLTVTSANATTRQVQYTIPTHWFDPAAFNVKKNAYGLPETVYVIFFRGGRPAADLPRLVASRPFQGDKFTILDEGFPWTTTEVIGRIRPGDTAVLMARGAGEPLHLLRCFACTVRNVKIYSSGINGIQSRAGVDTVFERVYAIPRPGTDRLISVNADGITIDEPEGGNVVRLSRSIRAADDGISPHSLALGTVVSRLDARRMLIRRQYGNSLTLDSRPVVFQNRTDGTILGNAITVGTDAASSGFIFDNTQEFTFDRDLNIPAGAVIYSTEPSERGSGTLIERNAVLDQAFARGISLWGLMDSTVQGNYVRESQMAAIFGTHRLMSEDWMSPPMENVTIRRNVVDGANTTFGTGSLEKMAGILISAQKQDFQLMTVSPHKNVSVQDNFVGSPARSGIRVQNVTGGSIAGNTLVNPNNNPYVEGYWEDLTEPFRTEFKTPLISTVNTAVTQSANTINIAVPRVVITDLTSRRLAAYAPGMRVRLHTIDAATLTSPSVTFYDADGIAAAAPVLSTAEHFIEVSVPSTSALGASWLRLTSGANSRYGTLFVDSQDNVPALNECSFELSMTGLSVGNSAGPFRVLAVTQPSCRFPVTGTGSVTPQGTSFTGTSLLTLNIAANTGAERTLTFEVAGQSISLTQTATCGFTLSPSSITVSAAAGSTPVLLQSSAAGCPWTATSNASFVTVSAPASGSGSGAVTVNYTANAGAARTGTVTIGGQTLTVSQSGSCSFSLTPNTITTSATGGVYNASLTLTGTQCQWVVQQPPSVTANPGEGTSAGTFNQTFTVYPNFSTQARTLTVNVGTAVMTITQAGNALTSSERFVQLVYFAFLGRLPAAAELASQSASLNAGASRASMVVSFFGSEEFNVKGRFTAGLYVGLLNRDAEFNGWIYQRGAMENAAITRPVLVTNFINSPEFQLQNGALSNENYVRMLYRQVLLREPSPSEVSGQAAVLVSGANNRTNMAFGFLASPEFQGGTGPRLTAFLLYAGLLQRDPSIAERNALIAQIQAGTTVQTAATTILNGAEFADFLK